MHNIGIGDWLNHWDRMGAFYRVDLIQFPDVTRSVATYHQTQSSSEATFFDKTMKLNRFEPEQGYSMLSVIDYIRAGFNLPSARAYSASGSVSGH